MTRLQRTLLVTAVVGAAGISGVLYLATQTPDQAERLRHRVESERLFGFGRATVRWLELHRDGQAVRFERDPAVAWRIDEPVRWPADLQAIEALIDRAAALREERTVYETPSAQQLEDTGLSSPRLKLFVETVDGGSHQLELGSTNPVTELLHVRADDGPVVVVDPSFRWALDRPLDEFRMDRLFPYRTGDVSRVRCQAPSGASFALERTGEDQHAVTSGGQRFDAGVGVTAVFLAAVTKRLEAEEYLSDHHPYPELPEQIASFEPSSSFTIEVDHVSGETRTATIALAMTSFTAEPAPIAWVGSTVVSLYPPPVQEILTTTADGLRDRSLAWFNPRDAHRIRVRYGDAPADWVFERAPGDPRAWVRVEPSPAEGVEAVFRDLVLILARFKGDETVTEAPSPSQLRAWLLDPPSRRFVVEDESGEVLADLRLGGWASDETLYARGLGPRVDTVSIDRVMKIPVDLEKLVRSP